MSAAEVIEAVAARLGDRAVRHAPLGALTTYRVGGRADLLVRAETDADLRAIADAVAGTAIELLVVGKGSNLLVADADFRGLAIVLGDGFTSVDIAGTRVQALAAAALPVVARRTVAAGVRVPHAPATWEAAGGRPSPSHKMRAA